MLTPAQAPASDNDLITLWITTGEQRYFTQLYSQNVTLLTSYFRQQGLPLCDADELSHDLLARLSDRLASFDPTRSFRNYLLQGANHTLIDHLRHRKARSRIGDGSGSRFATDPETECRAFEVTDVAAETAEEAFWRQESIAEVQRALPTIDAKYQDLLRARYFDGLSDERISEQFKLPLGTVKGRIRLGRQLLGAAICRQGGIAVTEEKVA